MTPEQFVYWLQGCLEITDPKQLNEKEIQVIKDHIKLVLKKETPNRQQLIVPQDFSIHGPGTTTLPYIHQTITCKGCGKNPCTLSGLGCGGTSIKDVAIC